MTIKAKYPNTGNFFYSDSDRLKPNGETYTYSSSPEVPGLEKEIIYTRRYNSGDKLEIKGLEEGRGGYVNGEKWEPGRTGYWHGIRLEAS